MEATAPPPRRVTRRVTRAQATSRPPNDAPASAQPSLAGADSESAAPTTANGTEKSDLNVATPAAKRRRSAPALAAATAATPSAATGEDRATKRRRVAAGRPATESAHQDDASKRKRAPKRRAAPAGGEARGTANVDQRNGNESGGPGPEMPAKRRRRATAAAASVAADSGGRGDGVPVTPAGAAVDPTTTTELTAGSAATTVASSSLTVAASASATTVASASAPVAASAPATGAAPAPSIGAALAPSMGAAPKKKAVRRRAAVPAITSDAAITPAPGAPTKPGTLIKQAKAKPKQAMFPSPGAFLDQAEPPSPFWTLPDELWLRIFQLGYCQLPMGRMRTVCRRFHALAAALTGRTLPTRRQKWCYHCLSTENIATGRYTSHLRFPLCTTCTQLPMHRALCESHMLSEFSLTKTDIDTRAVAYYLKNPRDRHFSEMKMYLYTTGERFVRAKWGDAYVTARRELLELPLNPYVKPSDQLETRAKLRQHIHRLKALGELARSNEKRKATLQRQADRKQRRATVKTLLKARGLGELATNPMVLAYGKHGVGNLEAIVDVLDRGVALKAAFEARHLAPLPVYITNPTAMVVTQWQPSDSDAFRTRGTPFETMARAFVMTGQADFGTPISASQIAVIAHEQTERNATVKALIDEIKASAHRVHGSQYSLTQAGLDSVFTRGANWWNPAFAQLDEMTDEYVRLGQIADASGPAALERLRAKADEIVTGYVNKAKRKLAVDDMLKNVWQARNGVTDDLPRWPAHEADTFFSAISAAVASYVAHGDRIGTTQKFDDLREAAQRIVAADRARCEEDRARREEAERRSRDLALRADADEPMRWCVTHSYSDRQSATADDWLLQFTDGPRTILTPNDRYRALVNFGRISDGKDYRRSDIPEGLRSALVPNRGRWEGRTPVPTAAVANAPSTLAVAPSTLMTNGSA